MEIQDQKYENRVETRHVEDDCLPLCFPSFEQLKKGLKVSDHKQKFDIIDECINFLGMDDEQEGHLCNQSQPLEKPAVCNEELNNEEEDGGSQMDVSFCFPNSEIFCQEEIYFLNPIEEMNDVSSEAYKNMKF